MWGRALEGFFLAASPAYGFHLYHCSRGGPGGGFPEAAPTSSATEGICKMQISEAEIATGRILTLFGSSWPL